METCADSYRQMDDYIRVISSQLKIIQLYVAVSNQSLESTNRTKYLTENTQLTIYTSYRYTMGCDYRHRYSNIHIVNFDALEIMKEYGYGVELLDYMTAKWNIFSFSRISDVLRLMLAHKFKQTYIDLDIVFLYNTSASNMHISGDIAGVASGTGVAIDRSVISSDYDSEASSNRMKFYAQTLIESGRYVHSSPVQLLDKLQHYFATAAVWSDTGDAAPQQGGCGVEYSNCAFCLPQSLLLDMISRQRGIISRKMLAFRDLGEGGDRYYYTELGPALFQKVLMNHPQGNIHIYSHNHPEVSALDSVRAGMVEYGHPFLHLTGRIRSQIPEALKGFPEYADEYSYGHYVQALFRHLGLPPVLLLKYGDLSVPSTSFVSSPHPVMSMQIPLPNRTLDDDIAVLTAHLSAPQLLKHKGVDIVSLYRELLFLYKLKFDEEIRKSIPLRDKSITPHLHACEQIMDLVSSKQFKKEYRNSGNKLLFDHLKQDRKNMKNVIKQIKKGDV